MRVFTVSKLGDLHVLKHKGNIIVLIEEKKEGIVFHSISDMVRFSRRVDE